MDPRWLVCADHLREFGGLILDLSPVEGAIGRHQGKKQESDHNVDRWGRVYGVDVLPRYLHPNFGNLSIQSQAYEFYRMARQCGFAAIGYYPDWHGAQGEAHPGFHLGTRRNRMAGFPATWGRLTLYDGSYEYVSIETALDITEEKIV
jgi:hypothetical protein